MNRILCRLSCIPMRKKPGHKAEQVSQLLFGETAVVLEEKTGWLKVLTDFDSYPGWIETRAVDAWSTQDGKTERFILKTPCVRFFHKEVSIILSAGSEIPLPDADGNITINGKKFQPETIMASYTNSILTDAQKFLYIPYLWGGRTVFGMDCSGFIQILFKINNICMPRDAGDQAQKGIGIVSLGKALPGDLLFFENEEKKISHVGLYLGKQKIIHASARVRISTVDEKGILDDEMKSHTHILQGIRRITP